MFVKKTVFLVTFLVLFLIASNAAEGIVITGISSEIDCLNIDGYWVYLPWTTDGSGTCFDELTLDVPNYAYYGHPTESYYVLGEADGVVDIHDLSSFVAVAKVSYGEILVDTRYSVDGDVEGRLTWRDLWLYNTLHDMRIDRDNP